MVCFHGLLCCSQTIRIERAQILLRLCKALFSRLLVPSQRIFIALWQTHSSLIEDGEITFCRSVSVSSGELHPFRCLCCVFLNSVARQIGACKIVLSFKDAFFSSHRI